MTNMMGKMRPRRLDKMTCSTDKGHIASFFLQAGVKLIFHININSQAASFEIPQHLSQTLSISQNKIACHSYPITGKRERPAKAFKP